MYRVCCFGLREQITRQRIEVVLSAHKVGAGLSAGEKMEKWQDRGGFSAREAGTPITKSDFQSLCSMHDEGTFMA